MYVPQLVSHVPHVHHYGCGAHAPNNRKPKCSLIYMCKILQITILFGSHLSTNRFSCYISTLHLFLCLYICMRNTGDPNSNASWSLNWAGVHVDALAVVSPLIILHKNWCRQFQSIFIVNHMVSQKIVLHRWLLQRSNVVIVVCQSNARHCT